MHTLQARLEGKGRGSTAVMMRQHQKRRLKSQRDLVVLHSHRTTCVRIQLVIAFARRERASMKGRKSRGMDHPHLKARTLSRSITPKPPRTRRETQEPSRSVNRDSILLEERCLHVNECMSCMCERDRKIKRSHFAPTFCRVVK